MKLRIIFYLLLVLFNLVSLYFIIDLFSYDEIVGYLIDGREKIDSTRKLAYLFFMTAMSNLYFLSLVLMDLFFKDKM
jgi:hypothetical protein